MIVLKARYTTKRPKDVSRDKWREIMRQAYRWMGLHWVATYLAGHFAIGAGAKYRYRLRTPRYNKRKDATIGGLFRRGAHDIVIAGSNRPNVLTGYAMREIMSHTVVRGFPTRASVYLYGPSYFFMRYRMNQPDKGKEITTVNVDEKLDLSRVLRAGVLKQLGEQHQQQSVEL